MTMIDGVGIGRVGPAKPAGRANPTAQIAAGDFRVPIPSEQGDAASAEAVHGSAATVDAGLVGLLALQVEDPQDPRDRPSRARGREMLAALAALQRSVLAGSGEAELGALAALLADMPSAADPRLQAALDAITLRVRVELARHGLG